MQRTVRVRAVIPFDGKCLFVKHTHDASFWALPGGKLETGEGLKDGLCRELLEELGTLAVVGDLVYVQQLFFHDEESLEFFFMIENGANFEDIDLSKTTHGRHELYEAKFIDPARDRVLPEFLGTMMDDLKSLKLPQVHVQRQSRL
ncbi:MAG TPA: NUDIX domain-containing protein [Candidatus Limnocylindrales bacterium]|nr:NUDIX domain-containing protein [Candidatus Limnocylindrales bacterium]